jgi:Rad3-related DNA helicase
LAETQVFGFKSGGSWMDKEKYEEALATFQEEQLRKAEEEERATVSEMALLENQINELKSLIDVDTDELKALKKSLPRNSSEEAKDRVKTAEEKLKLKRKECGMKKSALTRMTKKRAIALADGENPRPVPVIAGTSCPIIASK